jgi:hypothetical protein
MRVLLLSVAFGAILALGRDALAADPETPLPTSPAPSAAPSAPATPPAVLAERVEKALAALAAEPSLAALQRAALRLADADAESVRDWRRAANWSAALPIVKLVAEHDLERDEALDRYQDEPDRWGADTDRDYGFQVSAQWNLAELVFNPDEVRVYSALANRAARREALLTLLIGYYYERRRLQLLEVLEPAPDMAALLERRMRIDELTAALDALTGGMLSRQSTGK